VAPDKFKGSCTAREAAAAIVLGLRDAWGDGPLATVIPLADGGEGTVAAFIDGGATRVVLGIGGSATTDGGAGALSALGVRFLDAAGAALEPTPAALAALASIDASGIEPRLAGASIEIAADVDNPLLGPNGAAAVYGPQKGATPDDIAFLDTVLTRLADLASAATGRDLRDLPGAGAAGGLGWGLATFAGARLVGGFDVVAQLTGLAGALAGAALCITGEGRIDRQSLEGKVVAGVARLAAAAGVEVLAIGGSVDPLVEPDLRARGVGYIALIRNPAERERAMREAPAFIRAATARWARGRPVPI
jgi:glycerate 2-kinase